MNRKSLGLITNALFLAMFTGVMGAGALAEEMATGGSDAYVYHPVIIKVVPGSNAEQAGLRAGDVILKINGKEYRNPQDDEAQAALKAAKKSSGKLTLLVRGGGAKDRTIEIQTPVEGPGGKDAFDVNYLMMDYWALYCKSRAQDARWDQLVREGCDFLVVGKYREARQSLEKAVGLGLAEPNILEALGDACKEMLDSKDALNYYRKAAAVPSRQRVLTKMGLLLYYMGEFEELAGLKERLAPPEGKSDIAPESYEDYRRPLLKAGMPAFARYARRFAMDRQLRAQGLLPDIAKPGAKLVDVQICYKGKPTTEFVLDDDLYGERTDLQCGDFIFTCQVAVPQQKAGGTAWLDVLDEARPGKSERGIGMCGGSWSSSGRLMMNYPGGDSFQEGESYQDWCPWDMAVLSAKQRAGIVTRWQYWGQANEWLANLDYMTQPRQTFRVKVIRQGQACEFYVDEKLALRLIVGDHPLRLVFSTSYIKANYREFTLKVPAPNEVPLVRPVQPGAGQPAACLRITKLVPGGYGQWLGLKEDDLLISFAGQTPATAEALSRLIVDKAEQPTVRLAILRDGKRLEADVACLDLGCVPEAVRDGFRLYKEGKSAGAQYDALVKEGYAKLEADDCQGAAEAFQKAVNAGLADVEVLSDLMECYARLGRLEKAAEAGQKAVAAAPDRADIAKRLIMVALLSDVPFDVQSLYDKLTVKFTHLDDQAWAINRRFWPKRKLDGEKLIKDAATKYPDQPGGVVKVVQSDGSPVVEGTLTGPPGAFGAFDTKQAYANMTLSARFEIAKPESSNVLKSAVGVGFWGLSSDRYVIAGCDLVLLIAEDGTLLLGTGNCIEPLWKPTSAHKGGKKNDLRVTRRGSQYEVYLNGMKILTWYGVGAAKVMCKPCVQSATARFESMTVEPLKATPPQPEVF
jgi:tetratricopeptide (TPR) repeat protein